MKRLLPVFCLPFILVALTAACNKSTASSSTPPNPTNSASATLPPAAAPSSDQDAITEAIQKHLSDVKGINMSAMEMNVAKVTVNGDQAQADAEFRVKQGGPSMLITYFLERHAEGWVVVRNQTSNSGQFAHPPMDKAHSGATAPAFPDVNDFLKKHPSPKTD